MYFTVEPEVAGHLGKHSLVDRTVRPIVATRLHYEFDGWPEDDLVETIGCFVATQNLASLLQEKQLTGFVIKPVEVSTSLQFHELYGDRQLPSFVWFNIVGKAGVDDFGLVGYGLLVVSEGALAAMRSMQLNNCDIAPFVKR